MYRKWYAHITATYAQEDGTFGEKWRSIAGVGGQLWMMGRRIYQKMEFAPLYVHSFRLLQPRQLEESEKFNIQMATPEKLVSIGDKLRYYRHRKGLLQREVADHAGIYRTTYGSYEEDERDYYPIEIMERIAEILEVAVDDLLDDYNLFLYWGQGRQIKELRKRLGLTQTAFGKLYGVSKHTVVRWEGDKARVFKGTWVRVFL